MRGNWWPAREENSEERTGTTYDEIMAASRRGPPTPPSRPIVTLQRVEIPLKESSKRNPLEYDQLELRLKALQKKINLVRSHIKADAAGADSVLARASDRPPLLPSADSVKVQREMMPPPLIAPNSTKRSHPCEAFSHIAIDSDIDDDNEDQAQDIASQLCFVHQLDCDDAKDLELEEGEYCTDPKRVW